MPVDVADAGGIRGGTAIAGGALTAAVADDVADAGGCALTGGVTGAFGGITTTEGGRSAATEAGVTNLGAGGSGGAGLAGAADTGASAFASIDGAATGGFATGAAGGLLTGRATGCSVASFCCVIARSTSPGREIWERSIFVFISSSVWAAGRVALAEAEPASAWERRRLRTSSASWSSSELECVFFSVTPTSVRTSRMALLLTSSSRARSLIRIFKFPFLFCPARFECRLYARISSLAESLSLSSPLPAAALCSHLCTAFILVLAKPALAIRKRLRTRHVPRNLAVFVFGFRIFRGFGSRWFVF